MKKFHLILLTLLLAASNSWAVYVTVHFNSDGYEMRLYDLSSGKALEPIKYDEKEGVFIYECNPGNYDVTAWYKAESYRARIVLTVTEEEEQEYYVYSGSAVLANDGWYYNKDYTAEVSISSNNSEKREFECDPAMINYFGDIFFLLFDGDTYQITYTPTPERLKEAQYMTAYANGTVNSNVSCKSEIVVGMEYMAIVPREAELFLGTKPGAETSTMGGTHYAPFNRVEPVYLKEDNYYKYYYFLLADGVYYNYRTWINTDDGTPQRDYNTVAGLFRMSKEEAENPSLDFRNTEPYEYIRPTDTETNTTDHGKRNVGNILLNINEKGFLRMLPGETKDVIAQRDWQLINGDIYNYFLEPDYHYTVIDEQGEPTDIVSIERDPEHPESPWARLVANREGVAIVLATYDAIAISYDDEIGGKKLGLRESITTYGAIWPENTGVFVVAVGKEFGEDFNAGMTIHEKSNDPKERTAGPNVDAEHDIFYYLDGEEGYYYTFYPQDDISSIEVAYPTTEPDEYGIEHITYREFTSADVKQGKGEVTILLRKGRNIVRMINDKYGVMYQVLTAKPCSYNVSNVTRPGSTRYQPGDRVRVQFGKGWDKGYPTDMLFHPANKMAGIYNMSAFITYNDVANGDNIVGTGSQYAFAGTQGAQQYEVTISEKIDAEKTPIFTLSNGSVQVNGFGDPIGNHRSLTRAGRGMNTTAITHKTSCGILPDISIKLSPVLLFDITAVSNVDDIKLTVVSSTGQTYSADEKGRLQLSYGTYEYTAEKEGYATVKGTIVLGEDDKQEQQLSINLRETDDSTWDGKTTTEPEQDENGVYQIATGAELAWLAETISGGKLKGNVQVTLVNDIQLNSHPWTPIGKSGGSIDSQFNGSFDGAGHTISGLYINSKNDYQALICRTANGAQISNLTVEGRVSTTGSCAAGVVAVCGSNNTLTNIVNRTDVSADNSCGGIAGQVGNSSTFSRCANYGSISATTDYAGGIAGKLTLSGHKVTDSYNIGAVSLASTSTKTVGGLTGGTNQSNALTITNAYNLGNISGGSDRGELGGGTYKPTLTNSYTATNAGMWLTTSNIKGAESFRNGEVASLLGATFGQLIGVDDHPVIDGPAVEKNGNSYENLFYSRAITSGRYGTICLSRNAELRYVEGAEIYSIDSQTATSLLLRKADKMEAGKPYIFLATDATLKIALGNTETNEAQGENGLFGSLEKMDVDEGMWLLSNNKIVECGKNCTIAANRAYINLNEVPYKSAQSRGVVEIALDGDITAIQSATEAEGNKADIIYDLSGRRVNSIHDKGIYIINGVKTIIK